MAPARVPARVRPYQWKRALRLRLKFFSRAVPPARIVCGYPLVRFFTFLNKSACDTRVDNSNHLGGGPGVDNDDSDGAGDINW